MTTVVSGQFSLTVYDPTELPAWLSGSDLYEWVSIQDTKLSDLDAVALASYQPPVNPAGKVDAWCGGTLRRQGSVYMLGAAGGHGDYAGNEVCALALNVDYPAWEQVRPPTALVDIVKNASVYLDGRRAAIHTYWSTQYDHLHDRMLIVSGGGINGTWDQLVTPTPPDYEWGTAMSPPSTGLKIPLMAFDFATKDWLPPSTLGLMPYTESTIFTDALCCENPVTHEIFHVRQGAYSGMLKYSIATDTWSAVPGSTGYISNLGSAIDTLRNRMLIAGMGAPRVFDITSGSIVASTFGGLGNSVISGINYAGVVYDEGADCFFVVAAQNGLSILYRIDPVSYEVSQVVTTGPTPTARPKGAMNAIQYVPELRGLVFHNSYTQDVMFLRTAP